ncbi:MAG: ATP-grasp domain-containing protein, partial [Acidobacteriota bacterium]
VRGYVGVDLVLGDSGATVIEINPRLTTSYVGLRLSVAENIAGLIIAAALGRALPERVTVRGRCRFRADGNTALMTALRPQRKDTEGTPGWPIISAGTSAASI